MSNSAENPPSLDSLEEDSDEILELTEEVEGAGADDETGNLPDEDLGLIMPEFKVPSTPVSEDSVVDESEAADEDEFDREELVRTVRMEAFDRSEIELLDSVRKWDVAAILTDQQYAPDVLVHPPRVLTKKWQDGFEAVKPNGAKAGPTLADNRASLAETIQMDQVAKEDIPSKEEPEFPSALSSEDSEPLELLDEVPSEASDVSEASEVSEAAEVSEPGEAAEVSEAKDDSEASEAELVEAESEIELDLDSAVVEEPKPPPKPTQPPQVKQQPGRRQRHNTKPLPRQPHPTPPPQKRDDDDMGGIVRELLEEKKAKDAPQKTPAELKRENWFLDVFGEEYLRTIPDAKALKAATTRDVKFIRESLAVKPGARIFDLACGFGRHSIELAKQEFEVAGLDSSMALLQRALGEAQRRSLSIKFIHGDMRELSFSEIFDACFMWQTSFGYFDDKTNFNVLKGVHRALKQGGRFLLDLSNRDYVVAEMPSRTWWEGIECVFLEEVEFDHHKSILHTKRSFIYEDGSPPQEFSSYVRMYSLHELEQILRIAGFEILEVTGEIHHRAAYLGPSSSRLIVLAEKR